MLVGTSQQTASFQSHQRRYSPLQDPPELRGALFQQETDGTVTLLRYSGETSPVSPPDIGDDAAVDGHVFFSVNGIGQDWKGHRQQIKDWFHGGFDSGANLERPIIGIHEGDRHPVLDGARVIKNTLLLKTLQAGASSETIKRAAYYNDPSVKTIYDQMRQSLTAGRQITLMAHSGGGSQVALAMSILAKEEDGLWQAVVNDKVRVMATAATASREDFLQAGIREENLFMTGSAKDPVPGFYQTHIEFRRPWTAAKAIGQGVSKIPGLILNPGPYHDGQYIFDHNWTPEGSRIATFLDGGPGGSFPLP